MFVYNSILMYATTTVYASVQKVHIYFSAFISHIQVPCEDLQNMTLDTSLQQFILLRGVCQK